MDRVELELMLAEGLSLEEMGRVMERHPSTVAYWLRKYGLEAAYRGRHAARGGLEREVLVELIAQDLSVGDIAAAVARSKATVRYWLKRYGLTTSTVARRKLRPEPGPENLAVVKCSLHGESIRVTRSDGHRQCQKCRSEAVSARRRRVKLLLVAES